MFNKESKVLLIGSGIWYFGEGLFGPLLAIFTEEIGGTILDISWAWAAYLVAYGALSIIFGRMSDTFVNKERMLVFGYILNAAFTFGYLLVSDSISLFIVQAGLGVAAALATPTWNALFDEYTDASVDGTGWGVSEGMASIITGVSIILGALIVDNYSFRSLFIAMGIIQTIAAVYQAKILFMNRRGSPAKSS